MKTVAAFIAAFGVATAPAYAAPTKMSDQQMDTVTAAGKSLLDVDVVVTKNEIVKNTQVGVSAAIAVLGVAGSALRQSQ